MAETLKCLRSGQLIDKGGAAYDLNPNDYTRIGLYFSAHWCPPCRQFTPILVEFYDEVRAKCDNNFQIVFVSSDQDEIKFNEYFATMPWVALKFSDRGSQQKLSQTFGISGIPTLVIIDSQGNCVTRDGRTFVANKKMDNEWK